MIVITIAITASLNASSRPLLMPRMMRAHGSGAHGIA
jgi:hypothetical protein